MPKAFPAEFRADVVAIARRREAPMRQLARPRRLRSPVVTSGEVDRLLRTAYRINALGEGMSNDRLPTDVAIEIVRSNDGSVVVLPALAG